MEFHSITTSPQTVIRACLTRATDTDVCTKPALIFAHYWGGSSRTWHKLTSTSSPTTLSNAYPTVSVDLRGWGKSTGPLCDEDNDQYSPSMMAADLSSVLLQLKSNHSTTDVFKNGFVLVGHSMGAKVAVAVISRLFHSGKPQDVIQCRDLKGLVFIAPAPPTALQLPEDMQEQQRQAYVSEESVQWTLDNVLANTENLSSEDIEIVVQDSMAGNICAKRAWPTYGMREDVSDVLTAADPESYPHNMKVVILVGGMDVVEPKERVEMLVVEKLRAQGFQVIFRVVDNSKHLVPLENPQAVSEEIKNAF